MFSPCLRQSSAHPLTIKSKKVHFETGILRHAFHRALTSSDERFVCPIQSHDCSKCHQQALAYYAAKFQGSRKAEA